MGSFDVVMVPPSFNDDLCFTQGIEDFAVQQFNPHSPVEAFAVPVLPGLSRLNVGGLCSDSSDPVSERLSDKLWTVVRPDVGGNTA